MAGLVPAIHGKLATRSFNVLDSNAMSQAWIYMMSNQPNGILYLGVTTSPKHRIWQHREGLIKGFTKQYGLTRLVYAEPHADIASAIQRERNMKHWPRAWKVRLILQTNPGWADLYDHLV